MKSCRRWTGRFRTSARLSPRSARHVAQAQELLTELATGDLSQVAKPASHRGTAQAQPGRQANVLRHWLRTACDAAASTAQMEELLDQVEACTTRGHAIGMKVAAGRVELRQGVLRYITSAQNPAPGE